VASAVIDGDYAGLRRWLRAEIVPMAMAS
jgi:hypothetical protein